MQQLLDDLAAGRASVGQVAADFRTRSWPERKRATLAQAFGVDDDEPDDDPDSWAAVETDSRLSNEQYGKLAAAYSYAVTHA